jgi:alkyl hydroperoxide reductase subunit D
MSIENLKTRVPDHAKDLRINLGVIGSSTALSVQQAWVIALASAASSRNTELLAAIRAEAETKLTPEATRAALSAAAIMGMNNVYYRFLHMMGADSEYQQRPARLRMQVLGRPGVDHLDFELACLAASAITGCASCVRSHEQSVRDKGGTHDQVHDAVRIAAVIHGAAIALDASDPVVAAAA